MSYRGSALLIAGFFVAMQLFALPPDGFITGDQGSKFLQARAFAEHGPLDPSIDVLSRDIDPQYRHQEPKLKNRRGRLVSEFLWLLPLLTAPFFRLLGMRGLYVVPAIAVLVIFWAVSVLARRFGDRRGTSIAWLVLLAAPVLLFGLELWEHAPAAAAVLLAAVWLAPDRSSRGGFAAAGAAIALGALFREEVVPALPALLLARAWTVERDKFRDLVGAGIWTAIGAAVVFAASVPVNMAIYGAPLPMHVTQDAWEVAKSTPYMQVRRDIVVDLLLPASHAWLFAVAMVAGLGASVAAWMRRRTGVTVADGTDRLLLATVHAAVMVVLVIVVLLPLWRLATGVNPHVAYRFSSAAHTWPFALAILYWPWASARTSSSAMARYLVAAGLLLFAGTAIVVPTSGGSQWSPRFMFAVAPMLAVVAAAVMKSSSGSGKWMTCAIVVASIVMQLTGIAALVSAKRHNAELTHWLASRTVQGEVLISNVYWFPEVTATLAPTRRYLFSWSAADIAPMAGMATAHGLQRFSLVTSEPLTGYDAPITLDVPGGACRYKRGQQVALDRFGLTLSRYGCEER